MCRPSGLQHATHLAEDRDGLDKVIDRNTADDYICALVGYILQIGVGIQISDEKLREVSVSLQLGCIHPDSYHAARLERRRHVRDPARADIEDVVFWLDDGVVVGFECLDGPVVDVLQKTWVRVPLRVEALVSSLEVFCGVRDCAGICRSEERVNLV